MIYDEGGFYGSYLKKTDTHAGDMIQRRCFIRIREEGIYITTGIKNHFKTRLGSSNR